jgi:hypothetical protein
MSKLFSTIIMAKEFEFMVWPHGMVCDLTSNKTYNGPYDIGLHVQPKKCCLPLYIILLGNFVKAIIANLQELGGSHLSHSTIFP